MVYSKQSHLIIIQWKLTKQYCVEQEKHIKEETRKVLINRGIKLCLKVCLCDFYVIDFQSILKSTKINCEHVLKWKSRNSVATKDSWFTLTKQTTGWVAVDTKAYLVCTKSCMVQTIYLFIPDKNNSAFPLQLRYLTIARLSQTVSFD